MRVITGRAKGSKLITIEGLDTRPTLDRIKVTMFDLIPTSFLGKSCLDIFSGSGALGIEAISRGAQECHFVDQSMECVKVIEENLKHTKCEQFASIHNGDVYKTLEKFAKNKKFDIIIMDPPYNKGHIEKSLKSIIENDLLNDEGLIIVECSAEEKFECKELEVVKERNLNKVLLYILGKKKIGG